MITSATLAFLMVQSSPVLQPEGSTTVCGRTMRFEDQYCTALFSGRTWTHEDAAKAHERFASFALPSKAADAYLAAANNWMMAGQPARALVDFEHALASGLPKNMQAGVRSARDHAAKLSRRR